MLLKQVHNIEVTLSTTAAMCCMHIYFLIFATRVGKKFEASAKSTFVPFPGTKEL